MTAPNSTKEGIEEWVRKTGYPLELRVGAVLESGPWSVQHSRFFLDLDENKGREIDIVSTLIREVNPELETSPYAVYTLAIECKKAANPWVCFTVDEGMPYPIPERSYALRALSHSLSDGDEKLRRDVRSLVNSCTPYGSAQARLAVSFAEAFGKDEGRPFHALLRARKAAHFLRATERFDPEWLVHYVPIVVLEGELYDAHHTNGNLEVDAVDIVLCKINYQSTAYKPAPPGQYGLIVREPALPDLLSEMALRIERQWDSATEELLNYLRRHVVPAQGVRSR